MPIKAHLDPDCEFTPREPAHDGPPWEVAPEVLPAEEGPVGHGLLRKGDPRRPMAEKGGMGNNPLGLSIRTRQTHAEIKEALHRAAPHALARLIELIDSDDDRIALVASKDVLDRVLGRAQAAPEDVATAKDGIAALLVALAKTP